MWEPVFYTLDLVLICTSLVAIFFRTNEHLFSLSLLQVIAGLPLLAAQQIFIAHKIEHNYLLPMLFLAENTMATLWPFMAWRLLELADLDRTEPRFVALMQFLVGLVLTTLALTGWVPTLMTQMPDGTVAGQTYGLMWLLSVIMIVAMLVAAWRMEIFWRFLPSGKRWEYKYLVIGSLLVCATLAWAASYRIVYLRLAVEHLHLTATLLIVAWGLITYATLRHRLLNRRIFISRKVVYTFTAPMLFGIYLLVLGLVSLLVRAFGISLSFVLVWSAVIAGIMAVVTFFFSKELRRRVNFFISTNFYVNKYEFRDEWLSLSAKLQGASSETDVAQALNEVLLESIYSPHILIWIGDANRGYHPVSTATSAMPAPIAATDPLAVHLTTHPYLYFYDTEADPEHQHIIQELNEFFHAHHLELAAPLIIGDQLLGIIGLGAEFTGGRYGRDDFDLLAALGTQTASALMAIRNAEALAHARERSAWDRLSAFVLHDIKNAATMLSLVRTNAPANIQNPDFQQDMLEAMDDALGRMNKVQKQLGLLQEEVTPEWADVDLCAFLKEQCAALGKRLDHMAITLSCPDDIQIKTDPQLLSRILENLLLNTYEACFSTKGVENRETKMPAVDITVTLDPIQHQVAIIITDNGPGIDPKLLPDDLFLPLKTTKPNGSGIGLWQVRQLVGNLNGSIMADNYTNSGAVFTIQIPN